MPGRLSNNKGQSGGGPEFAEGLQLHLALDETGAGPDRVDDSGFGNDASTVGTVDESGTSSSVFKLTKSCEFNFGGGTDHLVIPATDDLNFGDEDVTILAWVRLFNESGGSGAVLARWGSVTTRSYILLYSATANAYQFGVSPDGTSGNTVLVTSTEAPIAFDVWYHLVAIHDSVNNQLRLHVTPDSESEVNAAVVQAYANGIWDANPENIFIARHPTGGPAHVHGYIDDLSVFRRALSVSDLNVHFNEGDGLLRENWPGGGPVVHNDHGQAGNAHGAGGNR